MTKGTALADTTNGAKQVIESTMPYLVEVEIEGSSPIIFHRWNCDSVEAKGKAAKGSKAKKEDDIESYVYRNSENEICIPGEYLRQAIIHAAKFKQDPRSPRKSAMDLFKAGTIVLTELASLEKAEWDYLDRRRVTIQGKSSAITRIRPAFLAGWKAKFQIEIILPEYIDRQLLNEIITNAGRLIGLADMRPTFGRFQIVSFK